MTTMTTMITTAKKSRPTARPSSSLLFLLLPVLVHCWQQPKSSNAFVVPSHPIRQVQRADRAGDAVTPATPIPAALAAGRNDVGDDGHDGDDSSDDNDDNMEDEEVTTVASLRRILHRKRNHLLQQHKASDDDNNGSNDIDASTTASTAKTVQEILLTTRIPGLSNLGLNKTFVATSTIPHAGRGLFASRFIGKGEVITCYPGDALLVASLEEEEEDGEEEDKEEEEDYEENDYDDDYDNYGDEEEWIDETVLWGTHVHPSQRWDEHAIFGTDDHEPHESHEPHKPHEPHNLHDAREPHNSHNNHNHEPHDDHEPLTHYACAINDKYSVMGLPSAGFDEDPAYSGHFANDAAGHLALGRGGQGVGPNDPPQGVEEGIATYVMESVQRSNAMHKEVDGLHMATVATRDIAKGEEIFVVYGPEYWMDIV